MPLQFESLTWTQIEQGEPDTLPDADTTVIGWRAEWNECVGCYLDGDKWRGFGADVLRLDPDLRTPTWWAPWPSGPLKGGQPGEA